MDYLKDNDPDLMLLDLNLPIMNGWEILEKLPTIQEKHSIPIYVLTSSIAQENRDRVDNFSFLAEFISQPINQMKIDEHSIRN